MDEPLKPGARAHPFPINEGNISVSASQQNDPRIKRRDIEIGIGFEFYYTLQETPTTLRPPLLHAAENEAVDVSDVPTLTVLIHDKFQNVNALL